MKFWIKIGLLLALPLGIHAQDADFYADINNPNPAVGERFKVTFTLEGDDGEITPPPLADFQLIYGPSKSSNFSMVNGKTSRSVSLSYVFVAQQPGKYTIEPATAKVGSKVLKSQAIPITVSGKAQAQQANPKKNTSTINASGNLILHLSSTKNTAYIGEPILLTYTLLSRYQNLSLGEFETPDLTGFWVEDFDASKIQWESQYETINGLRYRKAILKKRMLYPQKPGKLNTGTVDISCYVNRSFFNQGQKIQAKSNSLDFNVKPYPSGAPTDFSGITGSYTLEATVDKITAAPDDAITLKVKIAGKGNLKLLQTPEINFPNDFEVYDPKTKQNIKLRNTGLNGWKEFEYLIIPRYSGTYQIPEISFSYFNPVTKRYEVAKSKTIEITVQGDAVARPGQPSANRTGPRQDVSLLNEDIRYISTQPLKSAGKPTLSPGKMWFWIFALTIALLTASVTIIQLNRRKLMADETQYRHKKAGKIIEQRLKKSSQFLKSGEKEAFYNELHTALMGYFGDKFSVPAAEQNRPTIKEKLANLYGGEELAKTFIQILDDCEMVRYAPQSVAQPEVLFEKARDIIRQIEKS